MANTFGLSSEERYLLESLKNCLIDELLSRLDDFSFYGDSFYSPEDIILCLTKEEYCMLSKIRKNG